MIHLAAALSPERLAKISARREKENKKWEKQKARPKRNTYFAYIVLVTTLIYATDEIASQIGTLMKTEIANDLMANFGASSVSMLDLLTVIMVPFQALALIYRPLADRFGRKVFLVINTFGMSFAMLLIFLSNNIALYFVGAVMIQFFIPHDMHVVFIMESSPAKRRAITYSVIKFFANMGVMLIPLLRRTLMHDVSQWRNVFLVPAVVGLAVSLIALLCARETDAFIDARLAYLRKTDEEREAEKAQKKAENSQGGIIQGLKFAFQHKQLKWLYISSVFANIGVLGSVNYQVIMNYGYGDHALKAGLFADIAQAVEAVSINEVTAAIMLFPIGSALAQVIMGFICDSAGRKKAAIVTSLNCLIGFLGFYIGSYCGFNPYVVGFLCGVFVGSYYSTNDIIIMMVGESAPTNLRSSVMSAQFIVTAIGYGLGYAIGLPLNTVFGNTAVGLVSLCMLVPGFIVTLVVLFKKTNETKGLDLSKITGAEWD